MSREEVSEGNLVHRAVKHTDVCISRISERQSKLPLLLPRPLITVSRILPILKLVNRESMTFR